MKPHVCIHETTLLRALAVGLIALIFPGVPALAQPTFKKGQDPAPAGKQRVQVEKLSDEFDETKLDIQECVGRTIEKTENWAQDWDEIFHSNAIHKKSKTNPKTVHLSGRIKTPTKNWERFYVYGAWWKSPREIRFYLDGKYAYSIEPQSDWDAPSYMIMAIETYDWNPLPDNGGLVESGTEEQRTTRYDWVRTWKLEAESKSKLSDAPASASEATKLRRWKDASGDFSVRALLVGLKGNQVALKREDGSTIVVSLDKLAAADQKFVRDAVSENAELNFGN